MTIPWYEVKNDTEAVIDMSTGRYTVTDLVTGRKTVVEPIAERNQRANDKTWEKGNQAVDGGAIRREDSIITEENGFTNIKEVKGSGI